jgi:hypothetical protein
LAHATTRRSIYDYSNDRLLPMELGQVASGFRVRRGFSLVYDGDQRGLPAAVAHRAVETVNTWLVQHAAARFQLARSGKWESSLDVHGKKAVGNFVGRAFCDNVQDITWQAPDGLRNTPIDSGCPDLIPARYSGGDHEWTRFQKGGIEVKATCGALRPGPKPGYGESRVSRLAGVTWSAHHPFSRRVLGLVWDYIAGVPQVVGAFYAGGLRAGDFGDCKPDLSRRSGNSTNAAAIKSSGRAKFQWVCVYDDDEYVECFRRVLPACGL